MSHADPEDIPPYPLFSTTYALHRLSPLYHGLPPTSPLLDNDTLSNYARRLHNLLKGDVLRGVRVGLANANADEGLGRAGALLVVRWTVLRGERGWRDEWRLRQEIGDDTQLTIAGEPDDGDAGIQVEVVYERARYTGLLLRNLTSDADEQNDENEFTALPLLLTRMPGPLRETFLDFLATTFDAHATPLRLSSDFLSEMLERYIADLVPENMLASDTESAKTIRTFVKDVQLTLGFGAPAAPNLKSMDITVAKEDVPRFIVRGKKILQMQESKGHKGPFVAALNRYLAAHTALDMEKGEVQVAKIACGGFVLGAEGKAKIFRPMIQEEDEEEEEREQTSGEGFARRMFVEALVRKATGSL
jgi:hypothetical protein